MQTHLLNVTINWPRSVIFVRHSTPILLWQLLMFVLKQRERAVQHGSVSSWVTDTFPLCAFTTSTGDKQLFGCCFRHVSKPALLFLVRSSHGLNPPKSSRAQASVLSLRRRAITLPKKLIIAHRFHERQEAAGAFLKPLLMNGRKEIVVVLFAFRFSVCGIVWPQVFLLLATEAFLKAACNINGEAITAYCAKKTKNKPSSLFAVQNVFTTFAWGWKLSHKHGGTDFESVRLVQGEVSLCSHFMLSSHRCFEMHAVIITASILKKHCPDGRNNRLLWRGRGI